jgi:hypothetical protein
MTEIIPAAEKDQVYLDNVDKIGNAAENIKIYSNILEKEDLKILLEFLKSSEFSDGGEPEDEWYGRVLEAENVPQNIFDIMSKVYDFVEKECTSFYGVELDPWQTDSFSFVVWNEGDVMSEFVPEWAVHHHNICTTFYINDDYEDGEIKFSDHSLKVKVSKNSLMAFPGNDSYKNLVASVSNGTKYTANLCFKFANSAFEGYASFE